MKGTGENEVIVGGKLAQAGLEFALINETTGLVDDNQGEDGPVKAVSRAFEMSCRWNTHVGVFSLARRRGRVKEIRRRYHLCRQHALSVTEATGGSMECNWASSDATGQVMGRGCGTRSTGCLNSVR